MSMEETEKNIDKNDERIYEQAITTVKKLLDQEIAKFTDQSSDEDKQLMSDLVFVQVALQSMKSRINGFVQQENLTRQLLGFKRNK